ncbi:ribosomal protein S5 domain 2-type protein [Radiomyces spectabilis]|uniref:ribosomal protein S5 domain 2-type protein n=1 Tax=Radiomyces spectabilis TaxID=64574 RepID=UPI00221F8F2C|nr:ribosomal protein S5 domain 2-type protein [Radiomyces spectabilis]KAI8393463.1 ribosomal protein S5 domain 2-type protein [Radiomyces spectabilis]
MTVDISTMPRVPKRMLISAPGKVILFGEHAVVHQKNAVAASLGLRAFLHMTQRDDNIIHLQLPDVQCERQWSISELPLTMTDDDSDTRHPLDVSAELQTQFDNLLGETAIPAQKQATLAFLCLYIALAPKNRQLSGMSICTRSFVPVGAGLGSSASYSVGIATALLIQFGHIPHDFLSSEHKEQYLETINRYAFRAEQVIHGNPSGVDNAVATYGGAKTFVKGQGFKTLEGFQSLRLLLTNTKVPRSTSALVAGVTTRKIKYPQVIDPILDAIDGVSLRCRDAFLLYRQEKLSEAQLMEELEDLVNINHCLLQALGVSHASLEKIKSITTDHGMSTKLTGAGGGGCSVTLMRNDVPQTTIDEVMKLLAAEGFDCYQTSVGGLGVHAVELADTEDEAWMLAVERATLENRTLSA